MLVWIGVSMLLKARSLQREREERGEGRQRVVEAESD